MKLNTLDILDIVIAVLNVANYKENEEQNQKLTELAFDMENKLDEIIKRLDRLEGKN